MSRKSQRGLTLVELIVACTVMLVLTTMAMPLARSKVRAQRERDLRLALNELHRAIHRTVFRKAWVAIALYAAAIPLAFVNIKLVWALLAALPLLFFLPVVRRPMEWGFLSQAERERLFHGVQGES